jgi:membrane-associated phospholipid phosphatase
VGVFTWGIDFIVWLQTFSGPLLDGVFKFITVLGGVEFYLVLIPLVYWCFDRHIGARTALLFLLGAYVNLGLKSLFATPRPFRVAPDRVRALVTTETYGFPSAHAQSAATVWGYLAARLGGLLWIAGIGLPFVVGVSRMYLGVHSPADVLGGWALGGALAAAGVWGAPFAGRWWGRAGLRLRLAGAVAVPLLLAAIWPDRHAVRVAAALAGTGVGITLERRYVAFSAGGVLWKRALRFILGVTVLLALYLGLKAVLAEEGKVGSAAATSLAALRYCLVGLWIGCGAPLVFVRTRLAARETGGQAAATYA